MGAALRTGCPKFRRHYRVEDSGPMVQPICRKIWISGCDLGPDGAVAVADYVRCSASLKSLDLGGNRLEAEGAKALAPAVAASASLTAANLLRTNLNKELATILAMAAKEKKISLCGMGVEQNRSDAVSPLHY